MGNTLDDIIPKLLAQGLVVLRQHSIMPRLVNRDYSLTPGQKGSTVDVPVSTAIAIQTVTPGATPPSTADIAPTTVPVTVDTWQEAPFHLSDSDLGKVDNGLIPMQASEAIKSVANAIDTALLGLYKYVYGYVGTAATTPFNSTDGLLAAKLARNLANKQLMPVGDRRMVLDVDAEGNAIMLPNFQDLSKSGDQNVIRQGTIGYKLGADWWMDQNVQSHTAGTITTGLVAKSATAQALGLKAVVCTTAASTGAAALKLGDIVTFAGDDQTYVLTADATQATASTDVTLNVEPGLQVALAGGEDVTVKATHVNNLYFHREAFAFATRPLMDGGGLANTQSVVDPISGITLRLEISREHKRTRYSYDVLYGVKMIKSDLAVRVAG